MSSSLLFGPFDLCDMSSQVLLAPGFVRGAPVPNLAEVVSTVLDGSNVSGLGADNRECTLPLLLRASNRLSLSALANQILMVANGSAFTLSWTPDGGATVIYDCYRATSEITSTLVTEAGLQQEITLTFKALPYGRSMAQQSFTLAAATGTVLIDDYDTMPTVTPSVSTISSPAIVTYPTYHGAHCLEIYVDTGFGSHYPAAGLKIARTGLSISMPNGIAAIILQASVGSYFSTWGSSPPWTLSVVVGGVTYTATCTTPPGSNAWAQIVFNFASAIPAGTLTAYTLQVLKWTNLGTQNLLDIDYMLAFPASGARVSSPLGVEYVIPQVYGSARTPMNLQVSAGSAFKQFAVHTPPPDTAASQVLLPVQVASGTTGSAVVLPGTRYAGTYSVWASIKYPSAPGTATVDVTIAQGGQTVSLSHTLAASEKSTTNSVLVYVGQVTLPLVDTPAAAVQSYTVTMTSNLIAALGDILLFDTRGQTILNDATSPGNTLVAVNEPSPAVAFGTIYGTATGSPADMLSLAGHLITGANLWLTPPGGTARFLAWTDSAAPSVTATYSPRWVQEATI